MDLGSSLFSVICLLGAALCSNGDNIGCPCPNIPTLALTEPPLYSCYQINKTYRYKCIEGYKRKVGTSNLIKCMQTEGGSAIWSIPTLECIVDPNRPPPPQPPKSTVTTPIIETETTETTGTTGTRRTTSTSTTTEPKSNSTISIVLPPALPGIGSTTTAVIGCASLAFVLALIGISLYCYKRKSRNRRPPEPTEEQLYLNAAPSSIRVCPT
ncbi:interleukin-15 receptor subunit alpha isoform X7 [Etheostoma cragini]|uniref:interleukin-15 receptor subunit alpha isoform X7 n=1 Tax=Etheostoma cragini TaxID=417921 RepID=UPI00155E4E70|nr:interleukin-15 receptor subunit alpha isoform X7 [Etheostoma cragini]